MTTEEQRWESYVATREGERKDFPYGAISIEVGGRDGSGAPNYWTWEVVMTGFDIQAQGGALSPYDAKRIACAVYDTLVREVEPWLLDALKSDGKTGNPWL